MIKTKNINCTFTLRAKFYLKSLKSLCPNSIVALSFNSPIKPVSFEHQNPGALAKADAELVGKEIQGCKNAQEMNEILKEKFDYDWYMNGLFYKDKLPEKSWLCISKDNVEFIVSQDFAFDDIEGKKIHINKTGRVVLK